MGSLLKNQMLKKELKMENKTKQTRVMYQTPAFRLSYPSLFEAKETLNGDLKFSVNMLFPKEGIANKLKAEKHPASTWISNDNLKALYQEVVRVARANFGPDVDLKTLKMPIFRDGDMANSKGRIEENEKGFFVLRSTSKEKPKCIRQDKTVITDPSEMYPGAWVRAIITIAPFTKPQHGVTMYLQGVQKLADDVTFSGRPRVEDAFDEIVSDAVVTKNPWD